MQLLDSHDFENIDDHLLSGFHGFTKHSFEALQQLAHSPDRATYKNLEEQLLFYVKRPIEALLRNLAPVFDPRTSGLLETRKRTTSSFHKNDFGKGGCYNYLWGAYYCKGLTRRKSPQLCVKIHPHELFFGFALGNNSQIYSELLLQALRSHAQSFAPLFLDRSWVNDEGYDGTQLQRVTRVDELIHILERRKGLCLMQVLREEDVVDLGPEVIQEVEAVFKAVLPLFFSALGKQEKRPIRVNFPSLMEPTVQIKSALMPQVPKTIDELLERIHLRNGSTEAKLIRSVYEAAVQGSKLALPFRQMILSGAPGTGKTLTAELLAQLVAKNPQNIERVQFHPSFAYEDFVGGLRPTSSVSGEACLFRFESGVFKRLCDRAARHSQEKFVILIDEINRGNVAAIFGELMWALEYRDQFLTLPFTEDGKPVRFTVPSNVFVIGTMNSADRSIALLDYALRRRFKFIQVAPKAEALDELLGDIEEALRSKVKRLFLLLNKKLSEVNPDLQVGQSYFRAWPGEKFTEETLEKIWDLSIMPLLNEYFYSESRVSQFSLKALMRELKENVEPSDFH